MTTARLQLLIVEDDAAHIEAIYRAFETADTAVEICAVSTLREYRASVAAQVPDLVVMDLNLPDGRATDVLTHPPEDAPFPVVVMTAFGNQQIVVEVLKAGALNYIVKTPEAFDLMPKTVELVLREWRLLQKHKKVKGDLSAVLEATADGILAISSDNKILFANKQFAEMWKVSTEIISSNDDTLLLQYVLSQLTDPQGFLQKVRELYKSNVESFDTLFFKDGRVFQRFSRPLLREAKLDGRVWSFRDVTARRQTELALRDSEFRLQQAVVAGKVGLWEWNIDTNEIYYSAEWKRQIGYEDHEIANVESEWECRLHPDDRAEVVKKTDDFIEHPTSGFSCSFRFRHKDGSYRWILDQAAIVTDSNGKRRMLGSHVDITELKQVTENEQISKQKLVEVLNELRRTQDQIVTDASLRVLGQMASGIAHDFNNVLAPILGFSELLVAHPEKLADKEQTLKRLQVINANAMKAAKIVQQMRFFGYRSTSGEVFQLLDLNKLIRQTIELTKPRWKDQLQASGQTIQIVDDLLPVPLVNGDEFALREVLNVLIFNAVGNLPTGGVVTFRTLVVGGQSVDVLIHDTNDLSATVKQQFFETFSAGQATLGVGLGMALVQNVIERHGGTVNVASEPGQGTTFKISLPIPRTGTQPVVPVVKATRVLRPLRVLVVDDEPDLLSTAKAFLDGDGHKIETAANGSSALARLRTSKFDVVITDKAMPEMNGEQLGAMIKQNWPNLPVIMMTGFGEIMKVTGTLSPHINALLSKPFSQEELRAIIAKVLPLAALSE
ncbi:MAG: response regulator [Verrucomicrobiota bacterium]